jgi:hypothetical protein
MSGTFLLADGGEILADGEKYWRMARNTGGWRDILADSEKYWRMAKKYWRMARNTGG